MDPTNEKTYKFLETFIGEMTKLFPDKYFHIGGDEVNGKEWDPNRRSRTSCTRITSKAMPSCRPTSTSTFPRSLARTTRSWWAGTSMQPSLPKNIVIQSWRGPASLAQAAKQGIHGILSAGYYVDLNYSAAQHYAADPLGDTAASLTPEEQKFVLGGESCMWSEFVSPENMDSRIWPRTIAIAERLWSPQNVTDVNSMYQRMYEVGRQLDWLGITHNSNYGPMLRRIAASEDISSLKTLADVVEPVKGYKRDELAASTPTSLDPRSTG